jgi:hypothetical protein
MNYIQPKGCKEDECMNMKNSWKIIMKSSKNRLKGVM